MMATIIVLGVFLIYPVILVLIMSFNVAGRFFVDTPQWGLGNWAVASDNPLLIRSVLNSFILWFLVAATSFPIGIVIALLLSRTKIPFSHGLEYMFWVAYMFPSLSSTIGWIMLLDPDVGFLNRALQSLPFVQEAPFNIYSLPGLVWAKLMADGIAFKVMLFTPAFRNMDAALEEAARISGASKIGTMLRITLPVMIAPIVLILALQLIKVFQGFETEQLIGTPFGFYVYSTMIYKLVKQPLPAYGEAIVLGSITLLVILTIIPIQRWIIGRRLYTTVSGTFRPGLIDLGRWNYVNFLLVILVLLLLIVLPIVFLLIGSFMSRSGFFETTPLWTLKHWQFVLGDPAILQALRTTVFLAVIAGILSPLLFSIVAYMLVRTRLRGRIVLDSIIWGSAAIPGVLAGLGLLVMFLGTPGLRALYGTIWPLLIVVVLSGNTTGVNIFKGVLVQLGNDMEESARVSGAGWLRTYTTVVLPILMPTMVLIGVLNFVSAAGATGSVILLATRGTQTLSIIALQLASSDVAKYEAAGVISLIIMAMTLGVAFVARRQSLRMGVRHQA